MSSSGDGAESPAPHPAISTALDLDGDPDHIAAFYDRWVDTYDDDVAPGYGLPASMVDLVARCTEHVADLGPDDDPAVLDAGCGTGLIGAALAVSGYRVIDGVDLSTGMVARARGRRRSDGGPVFRRLDAPVDLTQPPPAERRGSYDLAVAGGVFSPGHVPPDVLLTLASWVGPGGVVAISVRQAYWEQEPIERVIDTSVAEGRLARLVHVEAGPYTADSTAHYLGFAVC